MTPVKDVSHHVVECSFGFIIELPSVAKQPGLESHGAGEEGKDGTFRHSLGPVRSREYDGTSCPYGVLFFKSSGPHLRHSDARFRVLWWAGDDAGVLTVPDVVDGVAKETQLEGTTEQTFGVDARCGMDGALIKNDGIAELELRRVVVRLVQRADPLAEGDQGSCLGGFMGKFVLEHSGSAVEEEHSALGLVRLFKRHPKYEAVSTAHSIACFGGLLEGQVVRMPSSR